jgi:ribosomal-protein-alanine N-acetyltransferase
MVQEHRVALLYAVEAMTAADVQEVLAIERASFRFPWSARAFLSDLALTYAVWRVARPTRGAPGEAAVPHRARWHILGSRRAQSKPSRPVVGYAGLQVILDEGHITNIAVHPDLRRRGIGELLLLDLIDQARPRGVLRLTLEVRTSNLGAQALYKKYGFTVEGRRLRYYGDGEDALIMWSDRLDAAPAHARLEELRRALWRRLAGD